MPLYLSSIERRPLKKNASTSSLGSARSVLSNASESSITSENNTNTHRSYRKSDPSTSAQNNRRTQKTSDPGIPPVTDNRKPRPPNSSAASAHGNKRQQKLSEPLSSTNRSKGKEISKRRQSPQSDFDEDVYCEEQDVKFFDIPSTSRPPTSQSTRSSCGNHEVKPLTTQDIVCIYT